MSKKATLKAGHGLGSDPPANPTLECQSELFCMLFALLQKPQTKFSLYIRKLKTIHSGRIEIP